MILVRLINVSLALACACLPLSGAEHGTADWSQFRGPNAAGVVEGDDRVPVSFGKDKNLLWKLALPSGAASPCIRGDRIFVTGFDRDSKKLLVYCINRQGGSILWQREVPATNIEKTHSAGNPACATPAADDERVYVYFGSYGLLCYSHEGEPLWSIEQPIPQTRNGSGTSPVIFEDLVLLNREEGRESYLLAVDRTTGKTVWKHDHVFPPSMMFEGYATPVIWNDQAILHTHAGVRSVGLRNGDLIWQVDTDSTGCSTPVIGEGHVYVATWNNLGEPTLRPEYPEFDELLKQDRDKNGTIGYDEFPGDVVLFHRPESSDGGALPMRFVLGMFDGNRDKEITQGEWEDGLKQFADRITDHGLLAIQLGGKGNITATHTRVFEKRAIPEVPSPLYHLGRLYIVKRGGIVSCYRAATGERLFRKRLKATRSYYASPIAVGQHVYLTSADGKISILKSADTLEVVQVNDLGERTLATPAVVDGKIYIRTDEHLYAFGST